MSLILSNKTLKVQPKLNPLKFVDEEFNYFLYNIFLFFCSSLFQIDIMHFFYAIPLSVVKFKFLCNKNKWFDECFFYLHSTMVHFFIFYIFKHTATKHPMHNHLPMGDSIIIIFFLSIHFAVFDCYRNIKLCRWKLRVHETFVCKWFSLEIILISNKPKLYSLSLLCLSAK